MRWVPTRSLALLMVAMVLAAACGGATTSSTSGSTQSGTATGPVRGGTLHMAFQYDPPTLDPQAATNFEQHQILLGLMNGLFTYAPTSSNLVPDLATSYKWSTDGRTLTVDLRHGVTFSNGDPFTSKDVVYSITRVLNPAVKAAYAGFYFGLVGSQAYYSGKATSVSGIKASGAYQVTFQLKSPEPYFLNVLALMNSDIVDHKMGTNNLAIGQDPIGTGPFKLQSWSHGKSIVLVRNPNYFHKGLPYLSQVDFTIGPNADLQVLQFERGQLDLVVGVPSQAYLSIHNNPKWSKDYAQVPWTSVQYLQMNPKLVPAFSHVRVRQALNYAIDKSRVLQLQNGRATVAGGILPPGIPGHDSSLKPYPYDPAKAKALLAQAGYPSGFSVTMNYVATPTNTPLVELVQSQLKQVGIQVNLKPEPPAVYTAMLQRHAIPFGLGGWNADYPDAQDFLYALLDGNSPLQRFNFDDPAADTLIAKADSITNTAQRISLYQQAQKMLVTAAPWVFLIYGTNDVMHQPYVMPNNPTYWIRPFLLTQLQQLWLAKH